MDGKEATRNTIPIRRDVIKVTKTTLYVRSCGNQNALESDYSKHLTDNMDKNPTDSVQVGTTSSTCRKWMTLSAGFFTYFSTIGFIFNMSVLYIEWVEEFRRPNAETGLIQSTCAGMFNFGGFVSGLAISKYGVRRCTIVGGILTALGLVFSYFATSIIYLVLMVGVIPGFGLSLCHISASTSVGSYFDGKSKFVALAFISVGAGIGSIVFPVLLEILSIKYGWRGTLLIIGGIMFNLVVCGCIFTIPQNDKSNHTGIRSKHNENWKDLVAKHDTVNTTTSKKSQNDPNLLQIMKTLLLNKSFMLYTFGVAVCLSAFTTPLIFLFDYFQSKGIAREDAVIIFLYMNIVNTIARFITGFLKQIPHISVFFITAVSSMLGCIIAAAFPFVGTSYSLNTIVACGFRVGQGNMIALSSISILKLVGQDNYPAGMGICMTVGGIVQALAGPISGYIRDVTGNYDASFFCTSAALFVSSGLFIMTMIYRHYNSNK